jgi:hypothetical protein
VKPVIAGNETIIAIASNSRPTVIRVMRWFQIILVDRDIALTIIGAAESDANRYNYILNNLAQ